LTGDLPNIWERNINPSALGARGFWNSRFNHSDVHEREGDVTLSMTNN
jgi:hypothetical protein